MPSDEPDRRGTTTRQKFGLLFFVLIAFGAFWVVGTYLTNSEPVTLSGFGTVSGGIDFALRILIGIGIPFFVAMSLWHDPKAKPSAESPETEWVMLVGGPHGGGHLEVVRGAPTAVYDGELYRRNDSDLFLHVG